MSGFEIVAFLLGSTGPIEQGIRLIQFIQNHVHSFQQNASTINSLYELFSQNRDQLLQLQLQINKCQSHLSPQGLKTFERNMSQVQDNIEEVYNSLKDVKSIVCKKGVKHFCKASNIATTYEELKRLLEKTNDSLVRPLEFTAVIGASMSIADEQTDKLQRSMTRPSAENEARIKSKITNDTFKPYFQCQHYTHAARPNFGTDTNSIPFTLEGRIKHRLLTPTQTKYSILAIQGEAGVGKTTTLNMLSYEPDIRNYFVDGIYCMSLGADASIETIIHELQQMVRMSGGIMIAEDREKWTNKKKAVVETSKWFKDKTFLILADDVWDTSVLGNVLQDVILNIVLMSPHSAVVFTTRDPKIATREVIEEVYPLRRMKPRSRESRAILMRHARHPEDSIFESKIEHAVRYILERTAGLPVAHSVAGRAVAEYALGSDNGISPWVWYVSINKSILQSSNDNYSSLSVVFSTAVESLEMNDSTSTSSELTMVKSTEYKRLYRSMSVFKKQQWILIPVLARLWKFNETVVRGVCDNFVRVGLAEWHHEQSEDEITLEGIIIHDLLHDFATEEAEKNETVSAWHDQILIRYSEQAGQELNENCHSWWTLKSIDHGYLMKNLFRHLHASSSYKGQMQYVVSRPQWISSQMMVNGIVQYEKDVSYAMKQEKNENYQSDEFDISNKTLARILEATRLSAWYIYNNSKEVWFQLHGRLLKSKESSSMRKYINGTESSAPRPWLM